MRTFRNFTLSLDLTTAKQVEELVAPLHGSVGGFAKGWVSDLSRLSPEQLRRLRELVHTWAEANAKELSVSPH